jgi:hypothetical protein
MPPIPEREELKARVPPHVKRALGDVFAPYDRHFNRHIGQAEMIGALIRRARRDHFGLMDDLAAYLDVSDAWKENGVTFLPE